MIRNSINQGRALRIKKEGGSQEEEKVKAVTATAGENAARKHDATHRPPGPSARGAKLSLQVRAKLS